MPELIEPKEITITDGEGKERQFIISKIPAFEGLEIMARYPIAMTMTAVPKLGDWAVVQELQLKIMKYIAVPVKDGKHMTLHTQALIDNHVGDWESLAKLILEEVKYNNSFFRNGTISTFFAEAFQTALAKIRETLTQSSPPSSNTEKPLSTNSAPSIP